MRPRLPLWLWLCYHARHGTGPILHRRGQVKQLGRDGTVAGQTFCMVVWYRCECRAVRTVSITPESD